MLKFKNLDSGLIGTAAELIAATKTVATDRVVLFTSHDATNDEAAWRLLERSGVSLTTARDLCAWVEIWEGLDDTELEVLAWLVDIGGVDATGDLVRRLGEAVIFQGSRAECAACCSSLLGYDVPAWLQHNVDWEGVLKTSCALINARC